MKRFFCFWLLCCLICALCSCQGGGDDTYSLTIKDYCVKIGERADGAKAAFGTPIATRETESCAGAGGKDAVYTYSSFEMQTYKKNGEEKIYAIFVLDDSIATDKGIRIGDTKDSVTGAYGTPTEETEHGVSYEKDGSVLKFFTDDGGLVTKIYYMEK